MSGRACKRRRRRSPECANTGTEAPLDAQWDAAHVDRVLSHGDRIEPACLLQVVGDERFEGGVRVRTLLFEPALDEIRTAAGVSRDVGHTHDPVNALTK